jgi:D-threo-aldose 1-dehydrogenase
MSAQGTRRPARTALRAGWAPASIGDLYFRLDDVDAQRILARAWDLGIRYFDTAPW